jgi:hypothetical protein
MSGMIMSRQGMLRILICMLLKKRAILEQISMKISQNDWMANPMGYYL